MGQAKQRRWKPDSGCSSHALNPYHHLACFIFAHSISLHPPSNSARGSYHHPDFWMKKPRHNEIKWAVITQLVGGRPGSHIWVCLTPGASELPASCSLPLAWKLRTGGYTSFFLEHRTSQIMLPTSQSSLQTSDYLLTFQGSLEPGWIIVALVWYLDEPSFSWFLWPSIVTPLFLFITYKRAWVRVCG